LHAAPESTGRDRGERARADRPALAAFLTWIDPWSDLAEADAATPGDPYHVTRRLVAGVATTAEDWVVDLAVESDRLKFRAKRDLW
jgi:hypothetical protein